MVSRCRRQNATPESVTSRLVARSTEGCAACAFFFAEKNPDAAKRAVRAIREGMKIIAKQPGIGRPAREMDVEFREWLIDFGRSGYVVLYHYDKAEVLILAVRHQLELGDVLGEVSGEVSGDLPGALSSDESN